ncbi:MAG TPA: tyrosine-type recombinase/integrase [Candidatus Binatia bacterium]|nr:tyrosine-type recombinase/integrase [Candidatus Binatia bacterium]
MVEQYFSAPKTLQRMRIGPCSAYLEGFVESLRRDGYTPTSIRRSLRAATHLGVFLTRRRQSVVELDAATLDAFGRHLLHCRCRLSSGRRTGYHGRFGAQRFHTYLIVRGVCRRLSVGEPPPAPPLVVAFTAWYQTHRGATPPTLRHYARGASAMLDALGPDVRAWTPQAVRQFLLTALREGRPASTQQLITATRAFVRYLAFRGEARPDLTVAIPAIARWRLASLPGHLTADQLARVLAACEGAAPARVRDRAIVLLLARLGLRAGDVLQLRLADLDWEHGTIRVTGKGRYQVRLPLPQEVGEAVARYLVCRPSRPDTDRVFLSTIAPIAPLHSADAVPSLVARALARGGVRVARPGAHILRHTAATEMLRHGVSLDHIGLVLRHRSLDVSAYYAKVDLATLRQVAQPWPGRRS